MQNIEDNNEKNEIPANKGSLGKAIERDPLSPLEDFHLPKESLKARQASIGERRKYFGPTSQKNEEEDNSSLNKNQPDIPPTDCEEPSSNQE